MNQLVRENDYKALIAGVNEKIVLDKTWGATDFDNLRLVFREHDKKSCFKKQLVGIHVFR